MTTPAEANGLPRVSDQLPPPDQKSITGVTGAIEGALDQITERRMDAIEMLGEEEAASFAPGKRSDISPGMRYLHASRTIHQLVTDRNRAVGVYLAVASLLLTASGYFLNARPNNSLIVPVELIQRWCMPVTFGTLTVLALFTSFILIRTRIGLIYEVAKMNALLGLPIGRVRRVNVFSIFFLMHLLVSLAGGAAASLFAYHLLVYAEAMEGFQMLGAVLAGVLVVLVLTAIYIALVLHTTTDHKLKGLADGA